MSTHKDRGAFKRTVDRGISLWYSARRRIFRVPEFQRDRFTELVLYVADQSAADESFGRTKLAKLLLHADMRHYAATKTPLTGATYRKKPWGPLALELHDAERRLAQERRAHREERDYFGKPQKRLVADAPPRMEALFTPAEIALVDQVIRDYWGEPGGYLSNLSHEDAGWRLARDNETIPYESVFLGRPTEAELRRGQELASIYGWE